MRTLRAHLALFHAMKCRNTERTHKCASVRPLSIETVCLAELDVESQSRGLRSVERLGLARALGLLADLVLATTGGDETRTRSTLSGVNPGDAAVVEQIELDVAAAAQRCHCSPPL